MKNRYRFSFPSFVFVAVAAGSLFAGQGAKTATDKIDPDVLASTAGGNVAEFWVCFGRKADLTPAVLIDDWKDRGRFVFDELRRVANDCQGGCCTALKAMGVEHHPYWINNTVVVVGDQKALLAVAGRQEVEKIISVGPQMSVLPLPGVPQPAIGSVEWNISQIGADKVWSVFGVTGSGIVVGTIDTGVQYTHEALVRQYRGNLGGGKFEHNYNWWDPAHVCGPAGSAPCDNASHGTHTMGTIAGGDGTGPFGNDIGVAPGVTWIAAKGCEGFSCSVTSLISAGQWMLAPTDLLGNNPDPDRRPHIVSNSWGGGHDLFFLDVVKAWRAAGIFPVFANGNSGSSCGTVISPGDYQESFGVGATDMVENIASFSSRGPSVLAAVKPDACAPGVNVRSSVPGGLYATFSGTSMATPHVAGVVALLWSAAPALIGDLPGTFDILGRTAIRHDDSTCGGGLSGGPNNTYGHGLINAYAAVASVLAIDFVRGADCSADGKLNITDPITALQYMFLGGQTPSCLGACDANGDERIDISDPLYMLTYLFNGGNQPPAPFPACGKDQGGSLLPCGVASCP